jgi:ribosomal protein S3
VWVRLPGLFEGNLDTLVAHLVYRLRGRFERRTKSVALPVLRLTQKMPGVVGARVRCHGRFTRRQRADRSVHKWGRLGRTHRAARVEDARAGVALRFGAVGVTVLVNYGTPPA